MGRASFSNNGDTAEWGAYFFCKELFGISRSLVCPPNLSPSTSAQLSLDTRSQQSWICVCVCQP